MGWFRYPRPGVAEQFRQNACAMLAAARHLHSVAVWHAPSSGIILWGRLAASLSNSELLRRLHQNQVIVLHGDNCSVQHLDGPTFFKRHAMAGTDVKNKIFLRNSCNQPLCLGWPGCSLTGLDLMQRSCASYAQDTWSPYLKSTRKCPVSHCAVLTVASSPEEFRTVSLVAFSTARCLSLHLV